MSQLFRYPYGSVAAIQRKFVAATSKISWEQPGAAVPFAASISESHTGAGSRYLVLRGLRVLAGGRAVVAVGVGIGAGLGAQGAATWCALYLDVTGENADKKIVNVLFYSVISKVTRKRVHQNRNCKIATRFSS